MAIYYSRKELGTCQKFVKSQGTQNATNFIQGRTKTCHNIVQKLGTPNGANIP